MRRLISAALTSNLGVPPTWRPEDVVPDLHVDSAGRRPEAIDSLALVVKTHQQDLATDYPVVSVHRQPLDALVSFWKLARDRRYTNWHVSPSRFALANLPRWLQTAETELERVQSHKQATILNYETLCSAPEEQLRRALVGWNIAIADSALAEAVRRFPPRHEPHGYGRQLLSTRVARIVESRSSSLWEAIQRHAGSASEST